jgi:hypothetical protein
MKNSLTLDSPTQQLIAEFRHAVMLNLVKPLPCIKGIRPSELQLRKPLERAHVLDFGFLLNAGHSDAISSKAQWSVNEASRDRGLAGLLLPFPQTVFLFRNLPHTGYLPGVTGFFQVLVLLEHVHGIAAHHFFRALGDARDGWGWAGSVLFDRDENNLKFPGFDLAHIREEETRMVLVNLVWTSLGLLNVKFDGEPVVVEVRDQAPRQPNTKMHRPAQPSISIVHINKPLVIQTRRGGSVGGRKMPGHDRRQHERTYSKTGKTITVRATKVNGGAKTSAFKRTKLDRPL